MCNILCYVGLSRIMLEGRQLKERKIIPKQPVKTWVWEELGRGILPPYKVMGVYLGQSQEIPSRLKAEAGCHRDVLKEKCFLLKKIIIKSASLAEQ